MRHKFVTIRLELLPAFCRWIVEVNKVPGRKIERLPPKAIAHCNNWGHSVTGTAHVQHKVTPILEGERRLVLSMTYCTDPRSWWWQGVSRRLKDTAFFGIRALWT